MTFNRQLDRWLSQDVVRRYLRSADRSRPLSVFPRAFPLELPLNEKARDKSFFKSLDPVLLAFLEELSSSLTDQFGGRHSFPENFYSLRNISGFYGTPVSAPVRSNRGLIKAKGFFRPLTSEEEVVYFKVFDRVWGNPIPTFVRLKRGASPGAVPEPEGRELAQRVIAETVLDHSREVVSLLGSSSPADLVKATYRFRAPLVAVRRHRGQPDTVSITDGKLSAKERLVVPEDQVSADHPKEVPVNKEVKDLPPGYEGKFFASRRRDVSNPSLGANTPMIAVAGMCRKGLYATSPYAFKHSTREVLNQKISGWKWAQPVDVVQYDQYFAWELFELAFKRMLFLGFDPSFLRYYGHLASQPTLMHRIDSRIPLQDPLFGANIFDPKTFSFARLVSGTGDTDMKGKDTGGGAIALAFFHAGLVGSGADMDALIDGKHSSLAFLTMGDDNLPGGTNLADKDRLLSALEKSPICQFKLDTKFGGFFIDQDDHGVRALPSVDSVLTNMFWKEHDQHTKTNFDIHQGFVDRLVVLSGHPQFSDLIDVVDRCMAKHFGFTLSQFGVYSSRVSTPDEVFRLNPNSIHYKLDGDEVTPSLMDKVMLSFPPERVVSSVEWVFSNLNHNLRRYL